MADDKTTTASKTIALNVKLTPVNHSNQPVSANYTNVTVASGIAYLDFGFIEPQALTLLARTAQNGKPLPKGLEGHLTARVAMGLDVVQRLHQQLGQVLTGLQNSRGVKQ
ncbi:MAG TPA: hypothetical protein VJ692_16370 [Nitrospiraceae bacterium]|nr:hypothetical protein [Nitrospiraceae bacterium]